MTGGPPPQEAIDATVAWATREIGRYYAGAAPWLPPRFTRREFGFLPIVGKFFHRHLGFREQDDLRRYLVARAPAHAYYSLAYYRRPDAPTMKEKEWLGADLVFDLDADHLPEVREGQNLGFEEQLVRVKREAVKLLSEFVLGDFGFDPRHVRVVFSGGRGYHIHVTDPRVHALGSAERREIVDYVTRLGLETDRFLTERTVGRKDFGTHVAKTVRVSLPPAEQADWAGRYHRELRRALVEYAELPPDRALVALQSLDGVGPKKAQAFVEKLALWRKAPNNPIENLAEGGLSTIVQTIGRRALEHAGVVALNDSKGEADEPVTADVKRLIRLPGSIHGKTGLRVVIVEGDDPAAALRAFDPMRDALAFGGEEVEVVVSKPEEIDFRDGRDPRIAPGRQRLPLRTALFLALRRKALLPWN